MPQIVQPEVGHVGFATLRLKSPCDHGAIEVGKEGVCAHDARPSIEHGGYGVIDRNDPPPIVFGMGEGVIVRRRRSTSPRRNRRISERLVPVCMARSMIGRSSTGCQEPSTFFGSQIAQLAWWLFRAFMPLSGLSLR
jgi:hypothetical protein